MVRVTRSERPSHHILPIRYRMISLDVMDGSGWILRIK